MKNPSSERKYENIDFWFMANASETIKKWFENKGRTANCIMEICPYFAKDVQIIWYEVDKNDDANLLFTRLNIGKIPLTSSELVKAAFLSRDRSEDIGKEKQEEIALQWDNIEKELHDNSLWCFLTNDGEEKYPTRIDLVLDLIADEKGSNRDKYHTFFHFDKKLREQPYKETPAKTWKEITRTFLILKSWREEHELYHKIGYLIASDTMKLSDIFELSKNNTKTAFKAALNEKIKSIFKGIKNIQELSYEKENHRKKIRNLLLLFNVESVRKNDEGKQWFPFDKHKSASWSLEHIHAQQSEGMNGAGRMEIVAKTSSSLCKSSQS